MKKKLGIFLIIFFLLLGGGVAYFFLWLYPINFESVSYEVVDKTITATLNFASNISEGSCRINEIEVPILQHQCVIQIPNEATDIHVKTKWNELVLTLDPEQDQVLDFVMSESKIYMILGEKKEITLTVDELGEPNTDSTFISDDESIAKVEGNMIEAVGNGRTKVHVTVGNITKEIEVISTNLIGKPTLTEQKEFLSCNIYSAEDNQLIDEFLEYRVNQAGYKSRGAVVAAARFLTLEFPYRIDYFWENGRLHNNTGGPAADGEGRYYHKGLYLNSIKFQELDQSKIRYGPATWGCPLTNWEDDPTYGFYPGVKASNGLDCSGFVTWVLYNAGFDPKDVGAGDTASVPDDLGDMGEHIPITRELLESGTLKPGDYIGSDGHAALIGGLQDGVVYVAESLNYGMAMKPYTYDKILNTSFLSYVIKMDDYYQEEGIYTNYWE